MTDDAPWLNCMDGFKMAQEVYPDDMFEEAERREKAMKAVEKLYAENGDALQKLAEIEKEERLMSRKSRAQEVMRAYEAEDTYNFPKDGVVAVLRYVADRLYTDWGELQHPASVIHDIANEVEELNKFYIEREKEQIKQNLKLSLKKYD
jgi:hypothetical protein